MRHRIKRLIGVLLVLAMTGGLLPGSAMAAQLTETELDSAPSFEAVEHMFDHDAADANVDHGELVEKDTAACWQPVVPEGMNPIRRGEITVIVIPDGAELPEEFTENTSELKTEGSSKAKSWQLFDEQIQVSFNPNGGMLNGSADAVSYQTSAGTGAAYPNEPIWGGRIFTGWALSADAKSPVYLPYDEITYTDGAIYYAVWEECYGYSVLTARQKQAYEAMEAGIRTCQMQIGIDPALEMTKDDMTLIRDMLESDCPAYFWFTGGMSLVLQSGVIKGVKPQYELDGITADVVAINAANAIFTQRVDQILAEMDSKAGNTEYDHALWLHDKVAALVSYTFTVNDQTAYGALVEGEAVCAGYAALYQYLLQRAGIKSWTVIGTSKNPVSGGTVAHAWTLMWLDGKCLYTDVTWDDQASNTFHVYFARNLSVFNADHTPNADYAARLPVCSSACEHYGYFDRVMPACEVSGSYSEELIGERLTGEANGNVWTAVLYHPEGADFKAWLSSASLSKMISEGGLPSGAYSFSAKIFGGTGPGREIHITIMAVITVSGTVTGATSGVTTVRMRSLDGKHTEYSVVVNSGTFVFSKVGAATTYELTIEEPGCCPLWYTFTAPRKNTRLNALKLNPLLDLNVSGSQAAPTVHLSGLPSGVIGTVMVTQYNNSGRMKGIRVLSGLQPNQESFALNNFNHAAGDTYLAVLLNQSGYTVIYNERKAT